MGHDDLVIDVIVSDKALAETVTHTHFDRIKRLIQATENLDDEETKILKNLDGQVDKDKQCEDASPRARQCSQDSNIEAAVKQGDSAISSYFDRMLLKTFENIQ